MPDPDIFGERRWGMFRYDVYVPLFDGVVTRLEKTGTPGKMIVGGQRAEVGGVEFRVGVYVRLFDRIKKRLEKAS